MKSPASHPLVPAKGRGENGGRKMEIGVGAGFGDWGVVLGEGSALPMKLR
jgi:hypothetical protein